MALKEIRQAIFILTAQVIIYSIATTLAFFMFLRTVLLWFRSPSGIFFSKRRELPPDLLNDQSLGEHHYIQIKNIKLHYVEKGDRTKPLMLFLHGFPDFWFSWRHQIKYFSSNYWTVAVDLRGFGESEKPIGINQYKIKYLINDIKNLITALGKEKCVLVSQDWGSVISWYFLLKYSNMIEKYVVLNVPPMYTFTVSWKQIFLSWYTVFFQIPYFPELYFSLKDFRMMDYVLFFLNEKEKEAYKFTFGKPGALTYGINYYRANLMKILFYKKTKHNMKFPKGLLIYTDNDPYMSVANFKSVKDEVENLEVTFIESATHFMQQVKYEEVNKIINEFLETTVEDVSHVKSVQSKDSES
ncbi:hypothetical protein PGB90_005076 [Kerria lacca]